MSISLGLLNFAIGQVKFFEEFKLQENCESNLLIKPFLGLVEMMFGLVNVSFSLPEWQAVKMTFFAPCVAFTEKESFYPILVSPLYAFTYIYHQQKISLFTVVNRIVKYFLFLLLYRQQMVLQTVRKKSKVVLQKYPPYAPFN